jgi:hypothetical protein
MRKRIAYGLFGFVVAGAVSLPISAQVQPNTLQAPQALEQKAASNANAPEDPAVSRTYNPAAYANLRAMLERNEQLAKAWNELQKDRAAGDLRTGTVPANCAHILILQPPPNSDPKIKKEAPKGSSDAIPRFEGLQVCPEDIRTTGTIGPIPLPPDFMDRLKKIPPQK